MTKAGTYKTGAFLMCILMGIFTLIPMTAGISLVAYSLPLVVYYILPAVRVPGERRFFGAVAGYSVCGAAIYLALYFLIGFIMKEIAGTPYDLSPIGILTNMGNLLPMIILRELTRGYCLGVIGTFERRRKLAVIILLILMAASCINFNKLTKITESEKLFIYIAVDVLPVITLQVLLTTLVYYGGAASGIYYQVIIEVFLRVFPVLPDLPWIAQSSLGIAYPVFMAVLIREIYEVLRGRAKKIEKADTSFYFGVILSVAFCWFCVGVFPTYPSVVLTGSMEPMMYPGDVILIKKMKEEKDIYQLANGDVINFDQEDINITHRIIELVYDDAGNISFRTKGDNNKSPDEQLVNPNNINGIVENIVPKAGMPLLILKTGEAIPEGVVDNEESALEKK